MKEKFIGLDIGGTKIFMSVVEIDFGHRSFEFLDSKKVLNPGNKEKIEKIVSKYCQKSRENFDTNKVAISSASIANGDTLNVIKVDDVYGSKEFNYKFLKEEKFQVVLENDGNAFALGSYYFDKNEDKQGLLTITLGTGIGGGFINSEGYVLRGKNGSATEFSHNKMFFQGKWVGWENISAARGIRKEYLKETGNKKTAREIFASLEKDEVAKNVIENAQQYLGYGLAGLINSFNPEKIVFGGGISEEKEYLEGAMEIAKKNVFHQEAFPEWEVSRLKAEMNVLGVCALYYI